MDKFAKNEINNLQHKINTHKRMIECLELRLHLIDTNKANKTEYEQNEDEIKVILTLSKIDLIKDKVFELEEQFNELCKA